MLSPPFRHTDGMAGRDLYRFETPRYRYAVVENAFAAFFNLDADRQGALRGRLKHLNQLGLPGLKTGKGSRISYSHEQVCHWLIALLMAELGIDPIVMVKLIQDHRSHFARWIRQATDHESKSNPVFLTIRPQLMSDPLNTVSWFGSFRRYNAKGLANVDVQIDRCAEDGGSWLCVRNLTADLHRLQGHLDTIEAADTASFIGETT